MVVWLFSVFKFYEKNKAEMRKKRFQIVKTFPNVV